MGIPRWAIAPDFPDINNVLFLGIAIDIDKFAAGFSADDRDMFGKSRDKFIKLTWAHIDGHKEEDFAHWITIPIVK